MHRRFVVERPSDSTGVSGTGIVIEGCLFSDGSIAYTWTGELQTWTWAKDLKTFETIVTHKYTNGTHILWIDEEFNLDDSLR